MVFRYPTWHGLDVVILHKRWLVYIARIGCKKRIHVKVPKVSAGTKYCTKAVFSKRANYYHFSISLSHTLSSPSLPVDTFSDNRPHHSTESCSGSSSFTKRRGNSHPTQNGAQTSRGVLASLKSSLPRLFIHFARRVTGEGPRNWPTQTWTSLGTLEIAWFWLPGPPHDKQPTSTLRRRLRDCSLKWISAFMATQGAQFFHTGRNLLLCCTWFIPMPVFLVSFLFFFVPFISGPLETHLDSDHHPTEYAISFRMESHEMSLWS